MNASSPASCRLFLRLSGARLRKVQLHSFLIGFILLLTQIGSAATYTVTNTLDTGTGSLRDAITQVNAGTGGDTINFSGVTGTITLASQIAILEQVTINGPGANILAISGGDTQRIFQVGTGAANTVISGLTITHGNASGNPLAGGEGGGIQTAAAITINNCTFSYNNAGSPAASLNQGGAIQGATGAVVVNGSTFFNNKAPVGNGGAIVTNGLLTVNNSTFYNNTAGEDGGAIFTQLGTRLALHNSTIVGNRSLSTTTGQDNGGESTSAILRR